MWCCVCCVGAGCFGGCKCSLLLDCVRMLYCCCYVFGVFVMTLSLLFTLFVLMLCVWVTFVCVVGYIVLNLLCFVVFCL